MSTQETEHQAPSFSNDNLNVSVTKLPHCHVKFDINVHPQAVQAAYLKAAKSVKKEISIPGFRKGKAPDNLIMEKYKPHIQREWVDLVLETAFNEAVTLTHLYPIKDGQFNPPNLHECSQEKGAKFDITFETRPVVPQVDFNEIKIAKIETQAITDKEKEQALHRLAMRFASFEPIEDRAAQAEDFIDLNVDILEGNSPKRVIQNQRVQINPEGLPNWVRSKVIGLKAGESAEGMTEQDNEQEIDPNFKSMPFRVTVGGIWQGTIPPIDDELATKVGVSSLDELQTKLAEKLEQEAQQVTEDQQVRQLEQLLFEKYPFELPSSLIEKNKQLRLEEYRNQLKKEGQESTFQANKQRIGEIIESKISQQLQLLFLIRKVAEDNSIEVQAEDVNQELSRQISLMSSGNSTLDFQGDKEVFRERLYSLALDRKIKQFLLDKAS